LDFVRTVAVARLLMPKSHVRIAAGRSEMSDEMQSLCFLAGANSIFYGDKLLTTENPDEHHDRELFRRLGIKPAEMATTVHSPPQDLTGHRVEHAMATVN
jgi:biotin synthase